MVPAVVVGVKTVQQLEENLGAMGWTLQEEDMRQLEQVSALPEPYPYEMINRLNKNRKRDVL